MKERYNTWKVFKQRKQTDLELKVSCWHCSNFGLNCCSAVWKSNASIKSRDKEKLTSNFDHFSNLLTFMKFPRKHSKGRKIETRWESWLFTNFPLCTSRSNFTRCRNVKKCRFFYFVSLIIKWNYEVLINWKKDYGVLFDYIYIYIIYIYIYIYIYIFIHFYFIYFLI